MVFLHLKINLKEGVKNCISYSLFNTITLEFNNKCFVLNFNNNFEFFYINKRKRF